MQRVQRRSRKDEDALVVEWKQKQDEDDTDVPLLVGCDGRDGCDD